MLDRRAFLQALAASVVAAGAPLPLGFPEDPVGRFDGVSDFLDSIDGRFHHIYVNTQLAWRYTAPGVYTGSLDA